MNTNISEMDVTNMIVSDLKQMDQEWSTFPEAVKKGLDYIRSTDFSVLKDGKYEIDGDKLFALVQSPGTKSYQKAESHRTYTDIQFLLSGEERIGVARKTDAHKITEDYMDEKDIVFYEQIEGESQLVLKPGMFAVFFPSDIHRPCCSVNEDMNIRKIVIKIHRDLLDLA